MCKLGLCTEHGDFALLFCKDQRKEKNSVEGPYRVHLFRIISQLLFQVAGQYFGETCFYVLPGLSFIESLSAFKLLLYFLAPPSNITTSSDQTITAPAELNLNCSADGKPIPTIFWTRVSDNTNVSMPLNIFGGKNEESYRCTAYIGIGIPLSKVVKITIRCE